MNHPEQAFDPPPSGRFNRPVTLSRLTNEYGPQENRLPGGGLPTSSPRIPTYEEREASIYSPPLPTSSPRMPTHTEQEICVSSFLNMQINWARVVREILPEGIREVGVAMWTNPPEIDIVFRSKEAMKMFDREVEELPLESESVAIHTLLGMARIAKSVYSPPSITVG